ncbi:basic salivary proline-rich protein 1-like [Nilaparvata lugens]|uniref:basic salivary proline-rich protein 1-like n=1 Tax=Nilaparvata lugens TaxID=108931 RepID=UPI00193E57A2|nr:basic salivary proline-rich protein 1-like [Nilaparvata lugens]
MLESHGTYPMELMELIHPYGEEPGEAIATQTLNHENQTLYSLLEEIQPVIDRTHVGTDFVQAPVDDTLLLVEANAAQRPDNDVHTIVSMNEQYVQDPVDDPQIEVPEIDYKMDTTVLPSSSTNPLTGFPALPASPPGPPTKPLTGSSELPALPPIDIAVMNRPLRSRRPPRCFSPQTWPRRRSRPRRRTARNIKLAQRSESQVPPPGNTGNNQQSQPQEPPADNTEVTRRSQPRRTPPSNTEVAQQSHPRGPPPGNTEVAQQSHPRGSPPGNTEVARRSRPRRPQPQALEPEVS